MRLALAISGQRPSTEVLGLARLAESLGLEEAWVTEDYCERGAFALAGALANATEEIKLGIGVVNPWTRHPVLTAMEAATVAELAPGRLILGLGASNPVWMTDQLGIDFHHPIEVLEEAVSIIRAILNGSGAPSGLEHFRVNTSLAFRPPSSVPLFLGVKGPRALQLAGEISDGVLLSVLSSVSYIRWARERLGDTPTAAYVAFRVDEDRETARAAIRPFVARFLGIHGSHPITATAGVDADLAQTFRDGFLTGDPREDLVTDELIDTFVVAGDRRDVSRSVAQLDDAGLETLVIHDQLDPDMRGLLTTVRDVVDEIGGE